LKIIKVSVTAKTIDVKKTFFVFYKNFKKPVFLGFKILNF